MFAVTVLMIVVVIVAAGAGIVCFERYRRRDRLVVRLCHLFELEPRSASLDSIDSNLRQSLLSTLKEKHTDFDFDRFIEESGVEPEVARQVAEEVYRAYFAMSQIDGVINRREAITLNALADVLHLGTATRERIEKQVGVPHDAKVTKRQPGLFT